MATKTKNQLISQHLLRNVPVYKEKETVFNVVKKIRTQKTWDTINYIYIIDNHNHLIGVLSIKELLMSQNDLTLELIMTKNPVGIVASSKEERASIVAIAKNIKAVPVFKPGTREFLGVVGSDKILEILHSGRVEDFLKFSGITKEHPTINFSKAPTKKIFKARLPWLLIGLLGSLIGSSLIGLFEETLKKEIALAFFIPVVVYITNAISTQTQALFLRALHTQAFKARQFYKKELKISSLLGVCCALAVFVFSLVWISSLAVSSVLAVSIVAGTLAAVTVAVAIPAGLFFFKKDPALGSGPFATAIQDIISIAIYFTTASMVIL